MPPIIGTDDDKDPNAPEAGGGAFVEGGGGGGPSTKGAPTSSGNYSNLLGYLNANQGAAKTTADGVAGHVGGHVDAANAANTDFGAKGANQIGGSFSELPGVDVAPKTGKAKAQAPTGPSSGGVGHGGADTPATSGYIPGYKDSSAYGVDPNVINSINSGGKAPTVTYKGPASTAALTGDAADAAYKAAGAASTARDDATAADGSMTGTASLLRNTYQQPSYTAGENTLDAFLSGSGENGAGITKAGERAGTAARDYEGVTNILEHQIGKNQADVAKTNAAYGKAAKEYVPTPPPVKAPKAPPMKIETNAQADAMAHPAADFSGGYGETGMTPGAAAASGGRGSSSSRDPTLQEYATDPGETVKKLLPRGGLQMAHGGEVPDFAELVQRLRS
jgi:hypothetical protein